MDGYNFSIYVIKNTVNDKMYIGQTIKSLDQRLNQHSSQSHCTHLRNAIDKYGRDKFYIELLDTATSQEMLNELEIFYIKKYDTTKTGYNLKEGGFGGGKFSEKAKNNMKIAQQKRVNSEDYIPPALGKKDSENTKKKKSQIRLGMKFSEEHKQNIAKSKTGKIASEETRRKMSLSRMGKKASEETLAKKRLYTHSESVKDKISKSQIGEGNGSAKLTWSIVNDIRQEHKNTGITHIALAEKHNVSRITISLLLSNKTWKVSK